MLLKGKEFKEHSSGLFVSSDGEVYFPKNKNKEPHFTFGVLDNGYRRIMRNNKLLRVHRLVAECFIPNPDNLPTVDHINRDKSDNRVENLRWASYSTQQYNREKYTRPNAPKNNANSKKVLQFTLDGELIKEWPSVKECCEYGFDQGTISKCCNGDRKTHKGFIWKYKKEEDD